MALKDSASLGNRIGFIAEKIQWIARQVEETAEPGEAAHLILEDIAEELLTEQGNVIELLNKMPQTEAQAG